MHSRIKSFVLRAGRVSNRQQQGLDVWLKNYELPLTGAPWSLEEEFKRVAPTIVEIGFGMGTSLFLTAQQNPHINYIGIEVHKAGIGSLAADLHDHQLSNVRIVPWDAVEVFQTQFADQVLYGVQIFFPDPWHKKKHNKRRLIQPAFIELLVKKIKSGGFLHCATDWSVYAEHMLEVLSQEETLTNKQEDGGYFPRPESRPITKFEQRAQRLEHGVWDLFFIRN